MKGEEQTNDAPPTTGSSTINIEGVEYTYTIWNKSILLLIFIKLKMFNNIYIINCLKKAIAQYKQL